MATAKKCDVCGKFYDVYNHKQDPNNPNGIMFLNIDGKGDYYRGTPTGLCPDCMNDTKSFIEMLKRKTEGDENRNLIYSRDSEGYEEWCEDDENGHLIHYRDSEGYERWYDYDENGNLIHYRSSDGYERWYEYDENGSRIHSRNPDGYERWYEYDENGHEIHFRDSEGREYGKENEDELS